MSIIEKKKGIVIALDITDPIAKQLVEIVNILGVNGVVLPATKLEIISSIAPMLEKDIYIMSPGIKAQGAEVGMQ